MHELPLPLCRPRALIILAVCVMIVSAILRLVGAAADLLSLLLVPPLFSPLLPIVAVLRVLILYWLQGCLLLLSLLRPILFLASTMKRSGMPRPLKSAMTARGP